MSNILNIYGTAESEAWCRDFDYADYLMVCSRMSTRPVSEAAYKLFCSAFNQDMEDDQ